MIRKLYYYFFYKLYALFELKEFNKMREWRVYGLILVLNSLAFFSVYMVIAIMSNNIKVFTENIRFVFTIFFIFCSIYNYIIFMYDDKWKKVILQYKNLSSKRDMIGSIIVYSIVILIVVLWICIIYLWPND